MSLKFRRTRSFAGVALLVVGSALGCSKSEPPPAPPAPTLTIDALPGGVRPRHAVFDGKITAIGYKMQSRGTMRPGARVRVSLYWTVSEKIEPGHRLLAELVDDAGEKLVNLDKAGPLRDPGLPIENWVPGKIYVDDLSFTVPRDVKTWRVQVVAGVAKGDQKLKITDGVDVDGLALMGTSGTGVKDRGQNARRLPSLTAQTIDAKTKIKLDGKLDETAWAEATAGQFVDVATGMRNKKSTLGGNVRLLWSEQGMYVAIEARDPDLVGGFKKTDKDPQLWTKDTVEIMIDPDGDGDNKDYYEIQINPQNLVFDSQFDDYNEPRKEPDGPFGHQEWSAGIKSGVAVDGTLDKSDDKDVGYTVEAFLPWKSLEKAQKRPPAAGDKWRMNFYVISGDQAVAWSPILKQGNFHKAARFGTIEWAPKAPPPEAAPVASAAAPAPEGAPANSAAVAAAPVKTKGLVEQVQSAKTKPEAPAAAPAPAAPKAP
ncbi:MAG: carbohydrate-binding family 9-like protein [Myxococcota bacterium]